jgi:hypothetical protein
VLRVTQMLRGLAGGMGVTDFSNVSQWAPYAEAAVRGGARLRGGVAPDSELALPPAPAGLEAVVGGGGAAAAEEEVEGEEVVVAADAVVDPPPPPALKTSAAVEEGSSGRRRRLRREALLASIVLG